MDPTIIIFLITARNFQPQKEPPDLLGCRIY
jgi:hypothetical protein